MTPADIRARLIGLALGGSLGLCAATQAFAWSYANDAALGARLQVSPDVALYPPWSILGWRLRFGDEAGPVMVGRRR